MKSANSSKTGPYKVSRLYDLISGGKRPLKVSHFQNAEFQTAVYPPKIGRTAVKLGENPFRTILHISFFEADFLGVAVPRPSIRVSAKRAAWGGVRGGVAPPGEIATSSRARAVPYNSLNL